MNKITKFIIEYIAVNLFLVIVSCWIIISMSFFGFPANWSFIEAIVVVIGIPYGIYCGFEASNE